MHLARVIGRLVATIKEGALRGIPLLWIQPLSANGERVGSPVVAVDRIGSGPGDVVVFITSREAAMTLDDPLPAVDAGIVAKVDWCNVRGERTLDG